MDFGAKYNGYCSDMTRTVVLGKADDEMKRVYNTVLEAQLAGIAAAHGGALGKDVDKAARDIIDNAGYKGLFGHSLGHSLGIEIHENPRYSPTCSDIITPDLLLSSTRNARYSQSLRLNPAYISRASTVSVLRIWYFSARTAAATLRIRPSSLSKSEYKTQKNYSKALTNAAFSVMICCKYVYAY